MLQHMDSLVVARGLSGLAACGILVAPPGIEPTPPEMEAWSLTHWTARAVPNIMYRKVQHQVQI